MAWKRYQEMSRIEQKLYWAVREESTLHEVPLPEIDRLPAGDVEWPAEDPVECSRVLIDWLDAGLITVMQSNDEVELLPPGAREVLAMPERWSDQHALVLTDAGVVALRAQEH